MRVRPVFSSAFPCPHCTPFTFCSLCPPGPSPVPCLPLPHPHACLLLQCPLCPCPPVPPASCSHHFHPPQAMPLPGAPPACSASFPKGHPMSLLLCSFLSTPFHLLQPPNPLCLWASKAPVNGGDVSLLHGEAETQDCWWSMFYLELSIPSPCSD